MTRSSEDKDSLVEMLAKIPITETRGSLLSAIGKLLRVIDTSESSIMIPTLLKDKCEFDAYEMLTLAKILKASILGHNDLVEFYMSESSSQLNQLAQQQHKQNSQYQLQLTRATSSSVRSSSSLGSSVATSATSNSGGSTPSHHHHLGAATTASNGDSSHSSSSPTSSTSSPGGSGASRGSRGSGRISGASGAGSSAPSPQAEHCGGPNLPLQLAPNGDPDATIRLLLQIEQLKLFIPQVTNLFESIIELYKNSVDTITKFGN